MEGRRGEERLGDCLSAAEWFSPIRRRHFTSGRPGIDNKEPASTCERRGGLRGAAAAGGGVGAGGVGGQWSLNTLFSKSQRGEKLCQPDTLRVVFDYLCDCEDFCLFAFSPPLCSLLTYLIGLRCDTLPHCVDNSRRNTTQTFALHPFFVFFFNLNIYIYACISCEAQRGEGDLDGEGSPERGTRSSPEFVRADI